MKKATVVIMMLCAIMAMGYGIAVSGENAPQKVVDLANSTLVNLGTDPIIVESVRTENAKNKTMDQIREMDKKWIGTPGIADFMKVLMDSECAKRLQEIQASGPYYAEIFVMDNQGANVAMTDKTSDYWQGDEAKFLESFKNGAGAVHISEVEFDDSAQVYLAQVSVPVKNGDLIIGVITIGIEVDKIE